MERIVQAQTIVCYICRIPHLVWKAHTDCIDSTVTLALWIRCPGGQWRMVHDSGVVLAQWEDNVTLL